MNPKQRNPFLSKNNGLRAGSMRPAARLGVIVALAALMSLAACDPTALTGLPPIAQVNPNSAPAASSTPGTSGGSGVQTLPTSPNTSSSNVPPTATMNAIKAVIEKANQEEVQAFASKNPSVMADTATSSYYQQMVQNYNGMANSGITAIQLQNLTWGDIVMKDANTAQANTTETWQTTYSDGGTTQDTNANIYTLVLQNGSWKIQDDQQPNNGSGNPQPGNQANPTNPTNPTNPNFPTNPNYPGSQGNPFGSGGYGVTPTPVVPTVPTNPNSGAPSSNVPSAATVNEIKAVIQKGNQEETQAFASQNPSVMADTSTSSYYQQMVQNYNGMANSGVQSIQLLNLTWGDIVMKDASTAQANTTEAWLTTYSDGSTTQDTNANVYTLVLQNGSWKIQDDQQPNNGSGNSTNPNNPGFPTNPANPGSPTNPGFPGGSGGYGVTPTPVVPTVPTNPGSGTAPSTSTTNALKAVIEKANQEEVQAFASQNPSVMADTATSSYYQQMVQNYNGMANSGVQSIKLDNLTWGDITLQNSTTATANTTETWSTTFTDGSTTQDTNANIYTLVLQNGSWKIQDDQQPRTLQPQPTSPSSPGTSGVSPTSPSTTDQSSNWAGYAATGGTFTSVSGTWTVPNVSASSSNSVAADATWVGIGGVDTTDLIQAGTQAMVQGGQVVYSAWWETLPQTPVTVPMDVNPGDSVTVSITQQGTGMWQVVIRDLTTGSSFQKSIAYNSSLSSAEWIEEAPATSRSIMPLDNFGTLNFTKGTAVENGKQVTIAQANGQPISMGGSSGGTGRRGGFGGGFGQTGTIIAQPSALGPDGSSFTVTRTNPSVP